LPKKHQKDTIFNEESQKTYYFAQAGGGGGQEPSFALPCRRPWHWCKNN